MEGRPTIRANRRSHFKLSYYAKVQAEFQTGCFLRCAKINQPVGLLLYSFRPVFQFVTTVSGSERPYCLMRFPTVVSARAASAMICSGLSAVKLPWLFKRRPSMITVSTSASSVASTSICAGSVNTPMVR